MPLDSALLTSIAQEIFAPAALSGIAIVAAWLGLLLGLAEWLHRARNLPAELSRKLVHIGTGHVVLLAWWLDLPALIGIAAAIVAAAIAIASRWLAILPSVNSIGRDSWGTLFYAISVGVSIGWFFARDQPHLAAIGIGIMAWGDGLAAIVGQRFGRHGYRVWGMGKSLEGSLTMFAASFAVSAAVFGFVAGFGGSVWAASAIVAVVATALEAFSKWGIDNLTVPLGSAIVALYLQGAWL
ncbi:MAG: diacylglycerol/polyprenol kinase family protein [Geitlerinemataceae cyanobacterium]